MRIVGIIVKVILIMSLLSGLKVFLEDGSRKTLRQEHIQIGQKVNGGDYSFQVRQVVKKGNALQVDVAITVQGVYSDSIFRDYGLLRFLELKEDMDLYGDIDLQASIEEDFRDSYDLQAEGDSLYVPRGRTKVVTYNVDVPEDAKGVVMVYERYGGRTYYELLFDLPIK